MAGISDLRRRLSTDLVMWVDPSSIAVQYSHAPVITHIPFDKATGLPVGKNPF
jgi:hypothetical protein